MEESNLKRVDNEIKNSEEKTFKQKKNELNDKIDVNLAHLKRYNEYVSEDETFSRFLKREISEIYKDFEYSDFLQKDLKNTNNRILEFSDLSSNVNKSLNDLKDELDEIEKSEREANRKEYEGIKDKKVDNISKTNEKKADNIEIVDF